ncbi:MAG: Flp family type IVb pilin [Methylocystaceae bacterium]
MLRQLAGLWSDEKGQGMVEYGLILALVALGCIALLRGMGTDLVAKFTDIGNGLK